MSTFKHGVHPKGMKFLTEDKTIQKLSDYGQPKTVFIPISQFGGEKTEIIVNVSDKVKKGQLIGKATGKFGVNIHASVSGIVKSIADRQTIQNTKVPHIEIENDFLDVTERLSPIEKTKENILKRLFEAGIIGMGGAAFPTHFKYDVPTDKNVDTLIINGGECEPYITCDYRLMLEKPHEILMGAKHLAKVLGTDRIIIGIEDNKTEAIDALLKVNGTSSYLKDLGNKIVIKSLPTKYPQGAEKMLIYATTKRVVPRGKLPSDVGCAVTNIHTAYSVFSSVEENLPLTERVVTISGKGVGKPGNYIIPCGTLLESLVAPLEISEDETKEIISGGPMMGSCLYSLDRAVTKASSSFLFLKEDEISTEASSVCINCGKCAKACPLDLMPMYIDGCSLNGDFENAKRYGAVDCMECGCCAFICPAKRPLVQSIRLAKKIIKQRRI